MPIFLEHVISRLLLPQLDALRGVIFDRVLPAFASVEDEAKRVVHEARSTASEDDDPADLAEAAFEAGASYLETMLYVRQSLLNSLAIQVSHLFDQQRHMLGRDTLLDFERDSKKLERAFREKLAMHSVDDRLFIHRDKLTELHLVANVAKHAEGQAAEKLRALRPELFTHELLRATTPREMLACGPITSPLMGDDLFVGPEDLRAYIGAVEDYWQFVLKQLEDA